MQVLHPPRSLICDIASMKIFAACQSEERFAHTHHPPRESEGAFGCVSVCVCVGCGWLTDRHTQTKSCAPRRCGRPGEWRRPRRGGWSDHKRILSGRLIRKLCAADVTRALCTNKLPAQGSWHYSGPGSFSLGGACEWNFPLWYVRAAWLASREQHRPMNARVLIPRWGGIASVGEREQPRNRAPALSSRLHAFYEWPTLAFPTHWPPRDAFEFYSIKCERIFVRRSFFTRQKSKQLGFTPVTLSNRKLAW